MNNVWQMMLFVLEKSTAQLRPCSQTQSAKHREMDFNLSPAVNQASLVTK